MKRSARSGTSSSRSRSGGARSGTTFRRKKQVLAEGPLAHLRLEVLVRRGDDAHVDVMRLLAARRATISPVWSARSTFACAERLMSPISSRKSVPPCASSNWPRRRAAAPEKLPFSWPKSSLSMSSRGDRRAVHLHERSRGALRQPVDRRGDELLAGAGLAEHEHARRSSARPWRSPRGASASPGSRRASRRAKRRSRDGERPAPSPRASRRESAFRTRHEHALAVDRLLEEVGRAALHGVDDVARVGVAADHDDRQVAPQLARLGEQREPVHAGQLDVEDRRGRPARASRSSSASSALSASATA